jgi:hypothetical protein
MPTREGRDTTPRAEVGLAGSRPRPEESVKVYRAGGAWRLRMQRDFLEFSLVVVGFNVVQSKAPRLAGEQTGGTLDDDVFYL